MNNDRKEECALLGEESDFEDHQDNEETSEDQTPGSLNKRHLKRKHGQSCLSRHRLCASVIAVLLMTLQVTLIALLLGMHSRIQELETWQRAEEQRAELNSLEQKQMQDKMCNQENVHKESRFDAYEQNLANMDSNLVRINQYVISLKSSYEKLKHDVGLDASRTQDASPLFDFVLEINRTASANFVSLRGDVMHLEKALTNATRRLGSLSERLSRDLQSPRSAEFEEMRAELSSLSGMVANLEIRMNKELDSAFAQIQTLGEEMGLAHSYPNTTELRATLTPAPERPAADTEPSPDGILLTDLKVQPTASGKHNNNILERPLRQTVSDLQLFFHQADENKDGSLSYQEIARVLKQQAPGEAELKVFDTNDDSLYSLAEIKRTQGRTE